MQQSQRKGIPAMRNPVRTYRHHLTRRELDRIAGEITRLRAADPELADFDGRESLYMRHAKLTRRLERLA